MVAGLPEFEKLNIVAAVLNPMKSFCQIGSTWYYPSIMSLDEHHTQPEGAHTSSTCVAQTSEQPVVPDGAEVKTPGLPGPEVAAAPRPGGKWAPVRQYRRNLLAGLRIALSFTVDPDSLCATPGALAALVITDCVLNLGVSFMLIGPSGSFAYSSIPSFFFHLPLLLFFGYLAGRILSRPSLITQVPVALVALSLPIEFSHAMIERIAQFPQFGWLQDYLNAPHYYRFFWWWSVTSFLFLLRIKGASSRRRLALLLLFLLLVVPPLWYFPRSDLWVGASEASESGELHLTEEVLSAQTQLLDGELAGLLPGMKGVTDLYFVGFAGDATQDVFLKEVTAADKLFERRFGTAGRTVVLANNPKTAVSLPFATAGNLARSLDRVAQVMNRGEDVLFLFLTSHGSSQHELEVNNRPLELDPLTPEMVRRMLKRSGIKWKVVVVSACYSGGFIDPLKDDDSLIITASDANHESFGCGFGENFTWFGEAFIDKALRQTFSFTDAFEKTRGTIRQWEEEQGETPSNPQIWVGREIAKKLAVLQKELEGKGKGI